MQWGGKVSRRTRSLDVLTEVDEVVQPGRVLVVLRRDDAYAEAVGA